MERNNAKTHNFGLAAAVIISVILFIAAVWRAFYGFDWSDESYYAALAWRITAGDIPFIEICDIHQTSAFITLPLCVLYRLFTGDSDGIILFLRFYYIAFQSCIAVFAYFTCRRKLGAFKAYIISAMIFLFAPFAIGTLSYNTMQIGFMILCALCFYRADDGGYRKWAAAAGVFYMLAVLSYPVLIIASPGFIPVFILKARVYKIKIRFMLPCFLAGFVITFLPVLIFLLSKAGFIDYIKALPMLFTEEDHESALWGVKLWRYIIDSYRAIQYKPVYFTLLIITITERIIRPRYEKISERIRPVVTLLLILYTTVALYKTCSIARIVSINYIAYYTALCVPVLLIQEFNQKAFEVFAAFWVPAVFSGLSVYLGSNNGINGAAYPYILGAIASIAFILPNDYKNAYGKFIGGIVYGACVLLIAVSAVYRTVPVYRDAGIKTLKARISSGPAAGIYTTRESATVYSGIIADLRADTAENELIAYIKCAPFAYMVNDTRCASHTLWWIRADSDRLLRYYRMNPEKTAEKIIVFDEDIGLHNENDKDNGGIIARFIADNYIEAVKREHYTLYIRK